MFKSLTVKIVSTMVFLTVLCMSLLAGVAFFELKNFATIQNQSANIQQLSLLARDLNDMADELKRDLDVFKV